MVRRQSVSAGLRNSARKRASLKKDHHDGKMGDEQVVLEVDVDLIVLVVVDERTIQEKDMTIESCRHPRLCGRKWIS